MGSTCFLVSTSHTYLALLHLLYDVLRNGNCVNSIAAFLLLGTPMLFDVVFEVIELRSLLIVLFLELCQLQLHHFVIFYMLLQL